MKKTVLFLFGAVALFLSINISAATPLCAKNSMGGIWAYQDEETAGWLTVKGSEYKLIARDRDYVFETNETGTIARIGDCTFELTTDKNDGDKSKDDEHGDHKFKKRLVYLSNIDLVTHRAGFGSFAGGTISRRLK